MCKTAPNLTNKQSEEYTLPTTTLA